MGFEHQHEPSTVLQGILHRLRQAAEAASYHVVAIDGLPKEHVAVLPAEQTVTDPDLDITIGGGGVYSTFTIRGSAIQEHTFVSVDGDDVTPSQAEADQLIHTERHHLIDTLLEDGHVGARQPMPADWKDFR